jgi:hypothetical protein
MPSSGMLRRVALVRSDVSEELSAYFIRVTRIGELGTTFAVTGNRRTLRLTFLVHRLLSPPRNARMVSPSVSTRACLHRVAESFFG